MTLRMPGRRPAAPAVRPQRPAALRPGARPGGGVRRTRPIRRRSAGLTPTRAGALLVLLAAIAGLYGAASSDAFAARRTDISGTVWTSRDAVLAAMAIPAGENLFRIRTDELAGRLAGIPSILSAEVSVALPDTVRVVVHDREALLAWQVGGHRYLVDRTGFLFGELPDAGALPSPAASEEPAPTDASSAPIEPGQSQGPAAGGAPGSSLPIVNDVRYASSDLAVGSSLDAVTLDAALRIGSLRPADMGSAATALDIRLDDADGFSVEARPQGWTAVFGFYTPTLRTTDLIAGQVRLLRSLILGREATVLRVVLADDRSGTYVPRPTPTPEATRKP